ncbi:LysR family transcriptional regulator [Rhodococcus rhodochrous]|uniref:LysR family transcriptional regulator n=1 Tax=Rhodococcus rhodochrous TaxID=1829 RepID=UPI001E5DB24A|nr:LysR family transcriptional regulator [Rhodococcus rhodochrous]MCB8913399.1 LysR family transcriptional regulator [Rhodococcus rhodochrous]
MAEPLDLVNLRTLVAIADTGGFRRAADALHLSQPTVSQHVRLLERRLKQSLVVKDGRGSRFTDAGEKLVHEARILLVAHEQMLGRLQADAPEQITIGSTEHAADRLLPEMLHAIRVAFDDARIQFRIDRSTTLAESVEKGTLDLAVVLGGQSGVGGAEVGRLDLRWVASTTWLGFDESGEVPIVAFEEPCGLRHRAVHKLADLGHSVRVVAESTSLDGVLAATRAGLGVALLPFSATVPDGLVEIDLLPPMGSIDVRIVARRGLSFQVEKVAVDAVAAHFAELAGRRWQERTDRTAATRPTEVA